ncbi:MAG: ABC transporter substrate-binding protein [Oscillospiraceae bacterium]
MQTAKRILAGAFALSLAFSVAGCGKKKSDSSSVYVDKVKVEDTDAIDAIPDDAEKELEWLSYFDLNPARGSQEKRAELDLFEKKGGTIKYTPTTSMTKFDTLANRVLSNDVPDMFWFEQKMVFPNYCVKEMFQPVDDIVDFNDDLWADVKDTADQFTLKGKHYVTPIKFVANSVLTYDKTVIEANAFEDPYELYINGEWDWDTWYNMMDEYVGAATGDEERYGVNGWFAPFIFQSTGHSIIEYDAEKDEYVSNVDDPNFDRATDLLYNIKKNGLYYPDWIGQATDCFKKNILFYAMGPWASFDTHTPKDGETWGMVPLPKDPNNEDQVTSLEINSYLWVKGSKKNEAMKCWLECAKIVNTDESYKEVAKEKFFTTNPNWTEEMYQIAFSELSGPNWKQLIDPGYGISITLSNDDAATNATKEAVISYMYSSVMKTDDDGAQYTWTQLRETYKGTIDSELKAFNEDYKKFVNG